MELIEPHDAVGARVAMLSLHTSPLDQPGTGDSGGMNVYVRSVAERLADRGVAVDVFTRCAGRRVPAVQILRPGVRVLQAKGGPCGPVAKDDLPRHLPELLDSLVEAAGDRRYTLLHAHYWLSGWAGISLASRWGVPLVASFHTLSRVKVPAGPEARDSVLRPVAEQRVARGADRIVAPTPEEAGDLVQLYGARAERVRVVPPGVDHRVFAPRDAGLARRRLGLDGLRPVVFVGRLDPVKAPEVAVRAFARAVAVDPETMRHSVLVMVGGPSGNGEGASEVAALMRLAHHEGIGERVRFHPPQSHRRLVEVYSAAETLIVPSRSESFGLVALEAQACGTPVVAADVGGLRHVVAQGESGLLIGTGGAPAFADALLTVMRDPALARRLGVGALRHAARFGWGATADALLEVYGEVGRAAAA